METTKTSGEYVVIAPNGKVVGKGFWGEHPERFWVDLKSNDAKVFDNLDQAESFIFRTGDTSWGMKAVER